MLFSGVVEVEFISTNIIIIVDIYCMLYNVSVTWKYFTWDIRTQVPAITEVQNNNGLNKIEFDLSLT